MKRPPIKWELVAKDGEARCGLLHTRRGVIETPVFMPVGTLGTVKGTRFEALESAELDARIILGNTYHLWLRPGAETIAACGGLHRFIGWERALLTDSGGFQVFSLGALRKVCEEGTEFRSHVDGSLRFLSPEVSMQVQAALASDIVMAFDECAPGEASHEVARESMLLTARWAERSRKSFNVLQNEGSTQQEQKAGESESSQQTAGGRGNEQRSSSVLPPAPASCFLSFKSALRAPHSALELSGEQALFGIIQGATHLDLRRESLARTVEIGFEGYALGGLSVGEEKRVMYQVVAETAPLMPVNSPRYLMGVGTPEDLIECVARGLDMFDCVLPTRNGRTGQAFTSRGKLNVKNAQWTRDMRPLDENCACMVCRRHTRAYLRHLYLTGEMLASILLTHHNLFFFLDTMRRVRQSIRSGDFKRFRREFLSQIGAGVE